MNSLASVQCKFLILIPLYLCLGLLYIAADSCKAQRILLCKFNFLKCWCMATYFIMCKAQFQFIQGYFPRAFERRVLPIVGVCKKSSHLHIFSSSYPFIFTSSHLHIFSSLHPLTFTSSHPHIFTSSHLHIFSSSHPHILTSSHLLIFTCSHLHILLILTSSHLHIFSSSYLLILTSSHLHILT